MPTVELRAPHQERRGGRTSGGRRLRTPRDDLTGTGTGDARSTTTTQTPVPGTTPLGQSWASPSLPSYRYAIHGVFGRGPPSVLRYVFLGLRGTSEQLCCLSLLQATLSVWGPGWARDNEITSQKGND